MFPFASDLIKDRLLVGCHKAFLSDVSAILYPQPGTHRKDETWHFVFFKELRIISYVRPIYIFDNIVHLKCLFKLKTRQ